MTVKNRRESRGTSGRPQSRGGGGPRRTGPAVKDHGKSGVMALRTREKLTCRVLGRLIVFTGEAVSD